MLHLPDAIVLTIGLEIPLGSQLYYIFKSRKDSFINVTAKVE